MTPEQQQQLNDLATEVKAKAEAEKQTAIKAIKEEQEATIQQRVNDELNGIMAYIKSLFGI